MTARYSFTELDEAAIGSRRVRDLVYHLAWQVLKDSHARWDAAMICTAAADTGDRPAGELLLLRLRDLIPQQSRDVITPAELTSALVRLQGVVISEDTAQMILLDIARHRDKQEEGNG